MSNKAITWAYAQHELRSGPKFVLVTLADMADQEHSCYPGVDMLMDLTGFGRTAVINHLNALIEAGYIVSERRNRKSGARTSNRYYLQLVPVENVEPETVRTSSEPKSGISAIQGPDSDEPMSGIRTAYKDEPKEEPKGEPSDQSLEVFELLVDEPSIESHFEAFWSAYPRHEAKKPAEAKFRKACGSVSPLLIIDGARRYAESVADRDPRHVAHPSTWLNQERWTDEITATPPAPRQSSSVRQRAADVDAELIRREQARKQDAISA